MSYDNLVLIITMCIYIYICIQMYTTNANSIVAKKHTLRRVLVGDRLPPPPPPQQTHVEHLFLSRTLARFPSVSLAGYNSKPPTHDWIGHYTAISQCTKTSGRAIIIIIIISKTRADFRCQTSIRKPSCRPRARRIPVSGGRVFVIFYTLERRTRVRARTRRPRRFFENGVSTVKYFRRK